MYHKTTQIWLAVRLIRSYRPAHLSSVFLAEYPLLLYVYAILMSLRLCSCRTWSYGLLNFQLTSEKRKTQNSIHGFNVVSRVKKNHLHSEQMARSFNINLVVLILILWNADPASCLTLDDRTDWNLEQGKSFIVLAGISDAI